VIGVPVRNAILSKNYESGIYLHKRHNDRAYTVFCEKSNPRVHRLTASTYRPAVRGHYDNSGGHSAVPSRRPPEPDLHLGPPVVSPPLRRQVGGDGVGGAARQHA